MMYLLALLAYSLILQVSCFTPDPAEKELAIETIVSSVGKGRLGLTSMSYLIYPADTCPNSLDTFLVGEDWKIGDLAKAYWSCYGIQSSTITLPFPHTDLDPGDKLTEEQLWANACADWPSKKFCHKNVVASPTDKCYDDKPRGTDALEFTDSYLGFYCSNITRVVSNLDKEKPQQLACFNDLKKPITDCAKLKVMEINNYDFCRYLIIVKNCFDDQYLDKCKNNTDVLPLLNDLFNNTNKTMCPRP